MKRDMPKISDRQIHRANEFPSTLFDYYWRNVSSISWSSDRRIKYGSLIHKMYAIVPLIGMGKVEENNYIEEIIHEQRHDLTTPGNAFEEYSR